jgi:outer membrane lipoprotein carrier protein
MKLLLLSIITAVTLFADAIVLPENFTANFTQMVTNPKKKVITYDGKLRFSAPAQLKWNYQNPTQKEVCVDGHQMVLVDHDLEQVSYLVIDQEFDFIKILKEAKHHHDKVYVSKYKDQSYTIQVDEKKQIQSVAYFDNLDNKVQIVFKQVKYGKGSLSPERMDCEIPKDFDILQ